MIDTDGYELKEHEVCPKIPKKNKNPSSVQDDDNFVVRLHRMTERELEIDFIGCDFSLINAYRRIVLAEVATMAIDKIFMYNNTSVVQDEVLCHRLGLIPLNIPPRFFSFIPDASFNEKKITADNCVKYKLKVKCRGKADTRGTSSKTLDEDEDDANLKTVSKLVTAGDLEWIPLGDQKTMFRDTPLVPIKEEISLPIDLPQNTNTDLVLCKLNPGQKIDLEAFAVKGIGSDHAKFQPGLCWYRMMPVVKFKEGRVFQGEEAHQLQKCFAPGVISIKKKKNGVEEAYVDNVRNDTGSRNVYNHDNLKNDVTVERDAKHIIFNIESQSALKSYEIMEAAVQVMIDKCDILLSALCKADD